MKKLLAIFLTLMLVLSLSVPAFAAEGENETQTSTPTNGSITVVNPTPGKSYSLYKVFDATYDDNNASYSYTADGEGEDFLVALQNTDSPFEANRVGESDVYVITLKNENTSADSIASFLKENLASLTKKDTYTPTTTGSFAFGGLDYGYYFVTTELGTVITISNVDTAVNIIDKNQAPGWEDPDDPEGDQQAGKNVSADGTTYAPASTAGIGDTVYFKLNANAPLYSGKKLVTEYIFVDTFDDAFTYNQDSLVIKANGDTLTKGTDYTATFDANTNKLTVVITVDANATTGYAWAGDTHLEFTYTAVLNAAATPDNKNTASMTWKETDPDPNNPTVPANPGDPENPDDPGVPTTPPTNPPTDVTTDTYTYGFNLIKVDEESHVITGAEFKLLDDKGNEIALVEITDATSDYAYRVATAAEQAADGFKSAVIVAGNVKIFGLDKGEYAIEETKAPAGYNMLTEPWDFETGEAEEGAETIPTYIEVEVENRTGTVLPETGGIGTTIFYVLGGILVVGAVVLLITKKRLSKQN